MTTTERPAPRPAAEARRGHLAMLAFSALVAGSFSLGGLAAPHIDPVALSALRFVLAAGLVGVAVAITARMTDRAGHGAGDGKGGKMGDPRAALWRYPLLGGLMALYFVLMFEGLKTAAPVSTSAVFTLTPVMAAGFGWLLLRQRLTPRMAGALAIGAAGALWVIFRADWQALAAFQVGRGEAIFFWGCVAHAAYAALVRRLNRGERAVTFTFGTMAGGALVLLVWGWRAVAATDWAHLPAIVWACLAYVTVAATAMTFVLLQYATLRLPAAKVMAYTYLVPSWVILWELALHGTLPPALVLAGVALTGLALLLLLKDEG